MLPVNRLRDCERLEQVLADCMEAVDSGQPPDPAAWVAQYPEFSTELNEFFVQAGWADNRLALLRDGAADGPAADAFAGYALLEELGRGGMGVVYRARQDHPHRLVALKMIAAGRFATPAERRRFVTEVEAASRLDHPNIVPVFEVGEAEGRPYFTMRLVDGGSLARHLERLRGDPAAGARLVAALARGVHHAHERGVLHRDLKPANVLLDAEDRPHVTDFGLARLAEGEGQTGTGELIGTPAYMAPEQAAGGRGGVTVAADVYGLGAVLYACLTGRPPFEGDSPVAVLEQVRGRDAAPPSRLNPAVPRDLDAVCLKCLEKDPTRRYASAAALADDLDRAAAGHPVRARRAGQAERWWRWARRRPELAAASALAAAALVAAILLGVRLAVTRAEARAAGESAAAHEFFATLERLRQRRANAEAGWTKASLADLKRAAGLPAAADYLVELRTEAAACLCGIDLWRLGPLSGDFETYAVAYSPDGKLLALGGWGTHNGHGRVRLVDGGRRTVRELSFPPDLSAEANTGRAEGCRSLVFSPDGRWLVAASRFGGLHRWNLSQTSDTAVSWPSGGTKHAELAFGVARPLLFTQADATVACWDAADDWKLVKTWKDATAPAIDPVGGSVIFSTEGRAEILDGQTLARCRSGLANDWRAGHAAVGPDGRTLAWFWMDCLTLVDAESDSGLQSLTVPGGIRAESDAITVASFHPRGSLLAAASEWSRRVKVWDVANGHLGADLRAGDRGSMRLAFDPSGATLVVATEGAAIAFQVRGQDVYSSVAMQPNSILAADIAPDGRAVACVSRLDRGLYHNGEASLWTLGADQSVRPLLAPPALPKPQPFVVTCRDRTAFVDIAIDRKAHTDYVMLHSMARPDDPPRSLGGARSPKQIRFDPRGRLWIVRADVVKVWDVPSGKEVARRDLPADAEAGGNSYYGVAPGRSWAVAGRRDGVLELLDDQARPVASWPVGPPPAAAEGRVTAWEPVTAVALDEEAGVAAAGTESGRVKLLRVPTGEVLCDIPAAHRDAVGAVALGRGGRLLATGGADRAVRLWQPDGSPILSLPVAGPCTMLAFSPDGAELYGLVPGERGLRRWHLGRLAARMRASGIEPGL